MGGRGKMTSLQIRNEIINLIEKAVFSGARKERACEIAGLTVRTLQRWQKESQTRSELGDKRMVRLQKPKNQLSDLERQKVISIANSDEFAHLPPSQIVPKLADRGEYVASESSFYRILKAQNQLAHRGKSKRPSRSKPKEYVATAPRQLFSWDITYLSTNIKGQFFYLYLFMDIFSRKIVGWQIYDREDGDLASDVLKDLCHKENIQPNQVVLHSDNGSVMKGYTLFAMLQELGVSSSFSRPAVSNDNPYSESLFRTLKYHFSYPDFFEDLLSARSWCTVFVDWYNTKHCHSRISYVTPEARHEGLDKAILENRDKVYLAAKLRHPERWSGETRNWQRKESVCLNRNQKTSKQKEVENIIQKAA